MNDKERKSIINIRSFRNIKFLIIYFLLLPWIFNFLSFFVGMTIEQGLAGEGPYLTDVLFTIANWPSLLLKIYPTFMSLNGVEIHAADLGLFNPLVILVNSIGWVTIGFIVRLTASLIKFKKDVEPERISIMKKTIKILFYIAISFWCFLIISALIFGLIFVTIAWQPSISNSFINAFMRIIGFFFLFIIPIIFTTSFIIATIIIIKNIKGKFLYKWQQILLWIIISSFIIILFYFINTFIF